MHSPGRGGMLFKLNFQRRMQTTVPPGRGKREVIELITSLKNKSTGEPDLQLFSNLLAEPAGAGVWAEYAGFYVGKYIAGGEMAVAGGRRAGQMDMIFIPYSKARLFVERAAVFVVRVARPEFSLARSGPRSLGGVQVMERIREGFPLVGLLHVCLPRPLEPAQQHWVKMAKVPLPAGWQPGDGVPVVAGNELAFARYDWLPAFAVDNQMQRMILAGLPKFAGINAVAITQIAGGGRHLVTSAAYQAFKPGYFNPGMKAETLLGIEKHFLKYGQSRYAKLAFVVGRGGQG